MLLTVTSVNTQYGAQQDSDAETTWACGAWPRRHRGLLCPYQALAMPDSAAAPVALHGLDFLLLPQDALANALAALEEDGPPSQRRDAWEQLLGWALSKWRLEVGADG